MQSKRNICVYAGKQKKVKKNGKGHGIKNREEETNFKQMEWKFVQCVDGIAKEKEEEKKRTILSKLTMKHKTVSWM